MTQWQSSDRCLHDPEVPQLPWSRGWAVVTPRRTRLRTLRALSGQSRLVCPVCSCLQGHPQAGVPAVLATSPPSGPLQADEHRAQRLWGKLLFSGGWQGQEGAEPAPAPGPAPCAPVPPARGRLRPGAATASWGDLENSSLHKAHILGRAMDLDSNPSFALAERPLACCLNL